MSESLTIASADPNAWLDTTHAWYREMNRPERWHRWRAVLDGFDTADIKKKFLPRTDVELDADYKFRIEIAEFLGITESAIERVTAAVFTTPARIESKNKLVGDFIKDCDGAGTSLVDFCENVSRESQGMGIAFVGIDREISDIVDPPTAAHEAMTQNLRCYATLYRAEEVLNWSLDERGNLESVVIGRIIERQPTITDDVKRYAERRVITKTTLAIWIKEVDENGEPVGKDPKWMLAVAVPHNVGVVPLVPVYGIFIGTMRGSSVHKGTMKADIARLNEETWSALDRYRHANQLLVLQSDRDLKEMHKGPIFRVFKDEDIKYVSPTSVAFDAQEKAIARLKQDAITQSGSNPAATSDAPGSTTGESGIAQRVRFTHTEQRVIKRHARSISLAIERILSIVEKWITANVEPGSSSVSFFTSFDAMDPSDRANTYLKLQYAIGSEAWHRHQLKKMAIETSPDATEEERATMQKEIDEQSIPDQPDPQTQGFGN